MVNVFMSHTKKGLVQTKGRENVLRTQEKNNSELKTCVAKKTGKFYNFLFPPVYYNLIHFFNSV